MKAWIARQGCQASRSECNDWERWAVGYPQSPSYQPARAGALVLSRSVEERESRPGPQGAVARLHQLPSARGSLSLLGRTVQSDEAHLRAHVNAVNPRGNWAPASGSTKVRDLIRPWARRTQAEVFPGGTSAPGGESRARAGCPELVLVLLSGAEGLSLNSTSVLSN